MISYEDFETQEAKRANYLVDLFEGNQLKYVELALSGKMRGGEGERQDWLKRGYVPRMRNIVRPIVEKSSMLFNKPPKYEVVPGNGKPTVDEKFNEILRVADFQEFSVNLDNYTRLLGATCVLQQRYIPVEVDTVDGIYRFDSDRGDTMVPMLLHRGNCVVVMNQTRTRILELAYITSGTACDPQWTYRYINPSVILDFAVDTTKLTETDRVTLIAEQANLAGAVTANMFYDTAKPRAGVWPRISEDLISVQEQLNTHLTDLEFARSRQLGQTLFLVNADVEGEGDDGPQYVQETNDQGNPTARLSASDEDGLDLGIGSIVSIKTNKKADGAATSVDYKGPTVDLVQQQEVVRQLLEDVAGDWAVTLKVGGDGTATSGFQLVVEELDNLQLRERRGQSFQAAFRRFYELTRVLYPELTDGQLQVIFAEPSLPVNKADDLKLWEDKIAAGLATREDYLMTVEGLTPAEAKVRAAEIIAANATKDDLPALLTLLGKGAMTPQQLADEMKRRGLLSPTFQVAVPEVAAGA